MTTLKRARMTAKFIAAVEASEKTLAELAATCDLSAIAADLVVRSGRH